VALTACNSGTFICGFSSLDCQSANTSFALPSEFQLVLRPSQVVSLIAAQSSSAADSSRIVSPESTCNSSASKLYSGATVGALGLGLGFPLAIALIAIYVLYRKHHTKTPSSIIYLPPKSPGSGFLHERLPPYKHAIPSVYQPSSIYCSDSPRSAPSGMPQAFIDKYRPLYEEETRRNLQAMDQNLPRYEPSDSQPSTHEPLVAAQAPVTK